MKRALCIGAIAATVALAGCAGYDPGFEPYVGTDAVHAAGKGGNVLLIRGIPVWDNCEPPVPYVVVGRLVSEGGRFSNAAFEMKMVARGAKEIGADAVILTEANNWPIPEVEATAIKYLKPRAQFDPTQPYTLLPNATPKVNENGKH